MAEWRAHQPQQQIKEAQAKHRDDDVVVQRVIEIEGSEMAALQAAKAVLAAGQIAPAECGGVGEGRQCQRQQREVNAAAAQDDDADECRRHGYHDHRQQQRQPDLAAEPVELDQPCGVGADAEPGAVTERYEAGVADTEIEPHRRDGERHHHDSGVEREPQQLQDEWQHDDRERRQQQRPVFCSC